jgi:hypothetical protein
MFVDQLTELVKLLHRTVGIRLYVTNRQVVGSIPDGVIGIFQ